MFLSQNNTPIFNSVKKHITQNVIPLHVPGHKHGNGIEELKSFIGENALMMDLTETDELDNACSPTGVILESEKLLADAFGANKAYFLVNGTTSGIQTMILSTCRSGDKILIPRNAHKSVFNALILSGAVPVYIYPKVNDRLGIAMSTTIDSIKDTINKNTDAKAIFIINPTYYGIASDISSITEIAHINNMLVLADEAHGTHMYFNNEFPLTAIKANADMSSISIHKTGGSLTQTSALLINDSRIDTVYVRQILNLICTTSPSYILMCSLDIARKQLACKGSSMLKTTLSLARWAREEINKIEGLFAPGRDMKRIPGCFDFDETKLIVNVQELGLTGYKVSSILRKDYSIQVELADLNNILAIVSLGDKQESLMAFVKALESMSAKYKVGKPKSFNKILLKPEMIVPPKEAFFSTKKLVSIEQSVGQIAGEMITAYPPGIPVICMGERITKDIVAYLKTLLMEGCSLIGASDPTLEHIAILG